MVSTKKRVKDVDSRMLLAFVLKNDPGAKECYKHLMRIGAVNIRPDYILFRLPYNGGERWGQCPDPGAWNAFVPFRHNPNDGMSVCMIRHGEKDWSIHS